MDTEQVQGYEYWAQRPLEDEQKDWRYDESNWVEGYELSAQHPHRKIILQKALALQPIESLLEVGCNVGVNIGILREEIRTLKDNAITGIDASPLAIERAKQLLPAVNFVQGNFTEGIEGQYDLVLSDAVLLYASPDQIGSVMNNLCAASKKAIILVERYANSTAGEVVGHVWGRDYQKLLEERGFTVEVTPITEEIWPDSVNWQNYGKIYVATRQSSSQEAQQASESPVVSETSETSSLESSTEQNGTGETGGEVPAETQI